MANFSTQEELQRLRQRLKEIRPDFADFEEEELILYPFVIEHLQKAGLKYQIPPTPLCLRPAGKRR